MANTYKNNHKNSNSFNLAKKNLLNWNAISVHHHEKRE